MNACVVPAPLSLQILGCRVRVECDDAAAATALLGNLGAMLAPEPRAEPDLRYRIGRGVPSASYTLTRAKGRTESCDDVGDLVFALEQDLTIELQRRRSDLLFLHAAALDWRGHALLLAAESGSGKSTTAWALLHHGFGYLSDELGPVDLRAMAVLPFPHALCLKHEPARPYALPDRALRLGRRIHVPADALPSRTCAEARPLAALVLVKFDAKHEAPRLRGIGRAEAAARLYVSTLNALAHVNHGLDAVVRVAEHVPCFALDSAALAPTAAMIRDLADRIIASRARAA